MRVLVLSACLAWSLAPAVASAQDVSIASLETLRSRAQARGFVRADVTSPRPMETWCAVPPCTTAADRFELIVVNGALVEAHVLEHDAADGFTLDGTWQASGSFGFRFTRGEEQIDLTWELTYEPPGMSVGFTARDVQEVVALDPADGAHAFELWIHRELSRHLSSAVSLRDTALAQRVSLRRAVARGVASGGVIREGTLAECLVERSTAQGTGFFDQCAMRPATVLEQRAALTTLDARLARERRLLTRHFRAFHRALRETFAESPRP
ncbi:MAG: hypothetical protein J0L92_10850 [Deltaproteobacteria bacterium]|nr:hypothetical protein [Deltaproteobacteria bacterium]